MFFRKPIFKKLPEDGMRYLSDFLSMTDLLLFAATSLDIMYSLLPLIAEKIQLDTRLTRKLCQAMEKEVGINQGDLTQERKLKNRAAFFLRLGVSPSSLATRSAEKGHTEIVKMLLNRGLAGSEVVKIAVAHNQTTVLEHMVQNGFALDEKYTPHERTTLVDLAIEHNSGNVLHMLGLYGSDFSEGKFALGLTPLQKALQFKFGETQTKFNQRFDNFLIMLKTGSFPKQGKAAFLEWLEKRYDAEMYRPPSYGLSYGDNSFGSLWEASMMHMDREYLNYVCEQISKIPGYKIAFKNLKFAVENALAQHEREYLKNKEFVTQQMNAAKKKNAVQNEPIIELSTFKKRFC